MLCASPSWERVDQPHMHDFLPRHVRELAIEAQAEMWRARTDPGRRPRKRNAHPAIRPTFHRWSARTLSRSVQSSFGIFRTLSASVRAVRRSACDSIATLADPSSASATLSAISSLTRRLCQRYH